MSYDQLTANIISEIKAKDAEIERLREELAKHQESEFNPDWSKLTATRASLKEHQQMIRELRAEVAGLRELLEVAQQGLLWYQDTYPNVVNDCDHEVMAQIAAALAARKGEA